VAIELTTTGTPSTLERAPTSWRDEALANAGRVHLPPGQTEGEPRGSEENAHGRLLPGLRSVAGGMDLAAGSRSLARRGAQGVCSHARWLCRAASRLPPGYYLGHIWPGGGAASLLRRSSRCDLGGYECGRHGDLSGGRAGSRTHRPPTGFLA